MKKNAMLTVGTSCSFGCLTVILFLTGLIVTSCHVPNKIYGPYEKDGREYYQKVLGVDVTFSHSFLYTTEGGHFDITANFKQSQKTNELFSLYINSQEDKKSYSFMATSPEANVVGLSKKETHLLEKSNTFSEFNRPVSDLLQDLLHPADTGTINRLANGASVSFCSTNLSFWKNFLKNYDKLNEQTYTDCLAWLTKQVNNDSYFYVRRSFSSEDLPVSVLHDTIMGDFSQMENKLKEQAFPEEIVKNFPPGTLFKVDWDFADSTHIYESDQSGHLVDSRYKYPVSY